MKFSVKVANGPLNKRFNFGGDPDHGSGLAIRITDQHRDTGKACLGGGMPFRSLLVRNVLELFSPPHGVYRHNDK